jgi:hypothetical protein
VEVERALEILRARKANFDRTNDNFRRFFVPIASLIGAILAVVVTFGVLKGEIHFGVVLLLVLIVIVVYLSLRNLSLRIMYPSDATPADYLLRHIGYRRSDGAILQEQIDEHERQLEALRQDPA